MKKSIILLSFILLFIGKSAAQTDVKIPYGDNKEAGNYKQINGNLVLTSFFNRSV